MPKSSAWATVDADQHVAVGRPHAAHGVTITPLAEPGKDTTFAVEATTPDTPLTRNGLRDLIAAIPAALQSLFPGPTSSQDATHDLPPLPCRKSPK